MLRKEAHGDMAELMEESAVDDKEADTNMAELMDAPAAGHKLYNCKTPRNTISCCPRPHPKRPLGLRRLQPAGESPCNQSGQRTPLIQTPTRFALCAASRGLVDQGANISLDKIVDRIINVISPFVQTTQVNVSSRLSTLRAI